MTDISASRGQASFPPWHQDYIPTADEWLNCFSNKADAASLEAFRKALFPSGDNNGDPTAQGSLYDRLSSLENKEEVLASLCSSHAIPVRLSGVTLDDYGPGFFLNEKIELTAKLLQQQQWAASRQKEARFQQKIRTELSKIGVTL